MSVKVIDMSSRHIANNAVTAITRIKGMEIIQTKEDAVVTVSRLLADNILIEASLDDEKLIQLVLNPEGMHELLKVLAEIACEGEVIQ